MAVHGHAMEPHLDDLIWTALTGEQARFSLGGDRARRFDPAIGPLAAVRDTAPASLAALAALLRETGSLALMQQGGPVAVPDAVIEKSALGVQMVFAGEEAAVATAERAALDPRLVPLTPADYPAMLALATGTTPGPFAARTGDLGDFWGVKEDGRLLAMAGQRLRTARHAEVSAVCTDPAARGRGLAGLLSLRVVAAIRAGGRVPILHSYADNAVALGLYRKLGFVTRAHVRLTQYAPQD
jgi:predicted GNAT family acetyltransferase